MYQMTSKERERFIYNREALKAYLYDENTGLEERMERFRLAWDLSEEIHDVMSSMARKTMEALVKGLRSAPGFTGYEIDAESFLQGERDAVLRVYKGAWCLFLEEPAVSYALKIPNTFFNGQPVMGILKQDNVIPFDDDIGDWRMNTCCLPPETWRALCGIWVSLTDVFNHQGTGSDRTADSYWIARQRIYWENPLGNLKFCLEAIEKGYEAVAAPYVEKFVALKEATEENLDKIVALCECQWQEE